MENDFNYLGIDVEEVIFGKEPWAGGRPSGEAFVRFGTKENADRAMELNGKHMGTRYLELFRVDGDAFDAFKRKMSNEPIPLKNLDLYSDPRTNYRTPGGYGGGGSGGGGYGGYEYDYRRYGGYGAERDPYGGGSYGGRGRYGEPPRYSPYDYQGHGGGYGGYGGAAGYTAPDHEPLPTRVQMRGIPFNVSATEIQEFFAPLVPIDIRLGYYENGRSTGDGYVEFSTIDEAKQALRKDRQNIGSRYVELFPGSSMKLFPEASYTSIMSPGTKPFAADSMSPYGYGYGYGAASAATAAATAAAAATNTRNPYADFASAGASGGAGGAKSYQWPY